MSKLRSLSIIEEPDFKKASRLEKFSLVLREPDLEVLLTNQEWEHWQRVQQVFALCFKQFDQPKAIRVIRAQIPGADRYEVAKRLYDDMSEVYGPVQRRNKDMSRAILVQRLWSIGVRLEQQGKLLEAAEVFEKAGKFEGLHEQDAADFNPDDIVLPVPIITNDPRYANAEQIEHEDVSDDEPQSEASLLS